MDNFSIAGFERRTSRFEETPPTRKGGHAKRSAEDTRALLLEIAVGMLHEEGVHAGVSHIRMRDVVHRAGLTTGAAYGCWPDQDSFHRDLAMAVVDWRDRASIADTV